MIQRLDKKLVRSDIRYIDMIKTKKTTEPNTTNCFLMAIEWIYLLVNIRIKLKTDLQHSHLFSKYFKSNPE